MRLNQQAAGVYIIAAPPFLPDGRLDLASVDRLTDFYLGCGVSGRAVLAAMGEAPKLDTEESLQPVRKYVLQKRGAIAHDAQRKPGTPLTAAVREEVDFLLRRLARFDARRPAKA